MSDTNKKNKRETCHKADTIGQIKAAKKEIAKSWSSHASELAKWAAFNLVNRTDAYGQYLSHENRTPKNKAKTVHEEISHEQLCRHFKGRDVGDLCGLHAISPNNKSGWLVIDIDCHGDDEELKKQNRAGAMALYSKAKDAGLKPLLIASNGRGGYHLWVLFKMLLPTWEVYNLGQWLVADWDKLDLREKPEA